MKRGMPALIEFDSIEENAKLCQELNLDFIELNLNFPYCFPENNDIDELKRIKETYGVEFTVHAPDIMDFGILYENVRQSYVDYMKMCLDFYGEVGVILFNLHLLKGPLMTLPDRKEYIYERRFKDHVNALLKSTNELTDYAKKSDIKICFENTQMSEVIKKAMLALKETDAYFTLDVGHDYLWQNKEYEDVLIEHELDLTHIHLHDVRDRIDHRELYTGVIDIDRYLNFKNVETVLIEVKSVDSLKQSIKKLFLE